MKVSLRATYGILAAMDLALQNGVAPVQAKSIARRHAIPARFLEQVLHALKRAGVVESLRGAQGGYLLSKPPSDISLAEIVEALDGPLMPVPHPKSNGRRVRNPARLETLLGTVWDKVRQAELDVLGSVTLQEIAERYQRLEQEHAPMYHI